MPRQPTLPLEGQKWNMRVTCLGFCLALALSQVACASQPPPPQPIAPVPTNPAALPPLPRSSIAAVILHRAELGLTDEQVGEMEQRDQQRERENAAVREEMEKKTQKGQSASSTSTPSGGGGGPQGMQGGGTGGGMHGGGMHGGRMGGRSPPSGSSGAKEADRAATLEDRLDENDTKAYLDVESVFTEAQKERAREIASDYREQLYEQRENVRRRSAQTK
ncbi:MAG TPA: hypothetical protein VLC06_09655 [Polyangia bacterium]|jgi:hypothetical protein|nr:hypothetical protein [Polyangia bacterium]